MAKMTDRLNRRCAGEVVSDDENEVENEQEDDKDKKSDEQQDDESSNVVDDLKLPASRSSTEESRTTTSSRRIPSTSTVSSLYSPRTTSNIQTMQQHINQTTSSGTRVLADDWSVSSIGQSSTSSPTALSLPPQTRRRKPFSGR